MGSDGQEQETTVPVSQAVVICGFGELGQTVLPLQALASGWSRACSRLLH